MVHEICQKLKGCFARACAVEAAAAGGDKLCEPQAAAGAGAAGAERQRRATGVNMDLVLTLGGYELLE